METCEPCNNCEGISKENYLLEVEFLTTLSFQTDCHTCTKLLD